MSCWGQKSLYSLCVGCLRLALDPQDLAPLVPVYFQNLYLAQPLALVLASSDKGDAWPGCRLGTFQRVSRFGKTLVTNELYPYRLLFIVATLLCRMSEHIQIYIYFFSLPFRNDSFVYGGKHPCRWMPGQPQAASSGTPSPLEIGSLVSPHQ